MSEEKTSGAQISLFGFDQAVDKSLGSESPKSKSKNSVVEITPTKVYANLDELKLEASVCQKCNLAKTRTNVVVERGDRHALIMIIGEAPGESEDETGLPFVGRSGQLLDKILTSVQFDPHQDVYVCNINKCRPPENRVPTEEEVAACKPYLLEQIRLVDPKIILLTGATAVKAITGDKRGITKIRGQWSQWNGRWVMPIFHPAYLLRMASREEGSPKWLMWQDIKAIKEKYLEIKSEIRGEIKSEIVES
jgi:uracil-DNA glycosylase